MAPKRNPGLRHPCRNQTCRRGRTVVHDHQVHLEFLTRYRCGVFTTEMLNRCEHVMAQVCTDFGATLAELNGAQDHRHVLVHYLPKVSLYHLVNSLKGLSSRRLRQDLVGRINKAGMRDGYCPRRTSPDRATAHDYTVKDYIAVR